MQNYIMTLMLNCCHLNIISSQKEFELTSFIKLHFKIFKMQSFTTNIHGSNIVLFLKTELYFKYDLPLKQLLGSITITRYRYELQKQSNSQVIATYSQKTHSNQLHQVIPTHTFTMTLLFMTMTTICSIHTLER